MFAMIELLRYQRDDGREPFSECLNGLRDKVAQARIRIRPGSTVRPQKWPFSSSWPRSHAGFKPISQKVV